jgi:hypothetical protein
MILKLSLLAKKGQQNNDLYRGSPISTVFWLMRFRTIRGIYIGESHYLVLFSIRTIPGIALIETVLTEDPLYQYWRRRQDRGCGST